MRILVVEDDLALAQFLQKGLTLEGHTVDYVSDGDAALAFVVSSKPDLMLLDLSLPRLDGIGVLEAVRTHSDDTAVLVLTARTQLEERIQCLNAGADDFLQKPFSFHELIARVRAVLRRRERFATPVLSVGATEMNLLQRSVRHDGIGIDLTTKEFMVLEALLRRNGQCCTRTELLRDVWPDTPESGANVVDVYVTYLRRKFAEAQRRLGPDRILSAVIETVRGAGYRMAVPGAQLSSTHALTRAGAAA